MTNKKESNPILYEDLLRNFSPTTKEKNIWKYFLKECTLLLVGYIYYDESTFFFQKKILSCSANRAYPS